MKGKITVGSHALIRAFEAVHRCASKDNRRAHINTVLLEVDAGKIRTAATNGEMLALYEEKQDTTGKDQTKLVLRLDDVTDALKILKSARWTILLLRGALINLQLKKAEVVLSSDGATIAGLRTVTEDFPPYEKVIPSIGRAPKFKNSCVGLRGELVTLAIQCFTAIGKGSNFLCWDFGTELDQVCLYKSYPDRSASLTIVIMPARMDESAGRKALETTQPKKRKRQGEKNAKRAKRKARGQP